MKIRYYRVNPKSRRAYWCPSKTMQARGFGVVALGFDGPAAQALAGKWNEAWQKVRRQPVYLLERPFRSDGNAVNFVYFLRIGDRIKIGTSSRPLPRVRALMTGCAGDPDQIVIVRGSRADERRLHERLRVDHVRGEWFAASRQVQLAMTRSCAAGSVVHDDETANEKVESLSAARDGNLNRKICGIGGN